MPKLFYNGTSKAAEYFPTWKILKKWAEIANVMFFVDFFLKKKQQQQERFKKKSKK